MKSLSLLLIILFVISCSSKEVSVYEETKILQIHCTVGEGTLDTFDDEYSQPAHGDVNTIPFYFSKDEQRRLIEEIQKVDYMNLPDTLIPKQYVESELDRINFLVTINECEVEYNGQLKKVYCSTEDASIYSTDEYKRFNSLLRLIYEIVLSRPEVKALPKNLRY